MFDEVVLGTAWSKSEEVSATLRSITRPWLRFGGQGAGGGFDTSRAGLVLVFSVLFGIIFVVRLHVLPFKLPSKS